MGLSGSLNVVLVWLSVAPTIPDWIVVSKSGFSSSLGFNLNFCLNFFNYYVISMLFYGFGLLFIGNTAGAGSLPCVRIASAIFCSRLPSNSAASLFYIRLSRNGYLLLGRGSDFSSLIAL